MSSGSGVAVDWAARRLELMQKGDEAGARHLDTWVPVIRDDLAGSGIVVLTTPQVLDWLRDRESELRLLETLRPAMSIHEPCDRWLKLIDLAPTFLGCRLVAERDLERGRRVRAERKAERLGCADRGGDREGIKSFVPYSADLQWTESLVATTETVLPLVRALVDVAVIEPSAEGTVYSFVQAIKDFLDGERVEFGTLARSVKPIVQRVRDRGAQSGTPPVAAQDDDAQAERVASKVAERLQAAHKDAEDGALAQRRDEQQRLAGTSFGIDVLKRLAALHATTPHAWREIEAFHGCGGERWNRSAAAKDRGKGYDNARKLLVAMAKCGLLKKNEKAKGQYRIDADGLRVHAVICAPK